LVEIQEHGLSPDCLINEHQSCVVPDGECNCLCHLDFDEIIVLDDEELDELYSDVATSQGGESPLAEAIQTLRKDGSDLEEPFEYPHKE